MVANAPGPAAGRAAGGAGLGAAAGLAGGPGVTVAAGVVAELQERTADRGAGQAAADPEELRLAGGALQPAGDQVDLVGQVAGRGAVEQLR